MRALAGTSCTTADGCGSGSTASPHVREQHTVVEARPLQLPAQAAPFPPEVRPEHPSTDGLAIASAVLGVSAIIPVLSQVLGIGLGVGSLVRIHRARRAGRPLRGRLWAWFGIGSSTFVLLAWMAVIAAFAAVGHAFNQAADSFQLLGP
jgi:hypothetical protein